MHANPLICLNGGIVLRGTLAMANRSMNWEDLMLAHQRKESYQGEDGITQKNMRLKAQAGGTPPRFTAALAHHNPLFCLIGLEGLVLLYRFSVLRESFPCVRDPRSWHHLPVLRAAAASSGQVKCMSHDSLLHVMKNLFEAAGVEVVTNDAITHFGRHKAQVEATKGRVPDSDIERGCNYKVGAREKFYAYVPPMAWQLNRGGMQWDDPPSRAAHKRSIGPNSAVLDRLVDGVLTPVETSTSLLRRQEQDLQAIIVQIGALPKKERAAKRKEMKLRSARDLLALLRYSTRLAIAILASRPRDEDGCIEFEQKPIYMTHARSPLLTQLKVGGVPLCSHPDFLMYAERVAALENEEAFEVGSPKTRRMAKACAKATKAALVPEFAQQLAAVTQTTELAHVHQSILEKQNLIDVPRYVPPDGRRPLLDGGFIKFCSSTASSSSQQLAAPAASSSSQQLAAPAASSSSQQLAAPAASADGDVPAHSPAPAAPPAETRLTAKVPRVPVVAETATHDEAFAAVAAASKAIALAAIGSSPKTVALFASALDTLVSNQKDESPEARMLKRGLTEAAAVAHSKIPKLAADATGRQRSADLEADGQVVVDPVQQFDNSYEKLWRNWVTKLRPHELKGKQWRTCNPTVNGNYNDRQFFLREVVRHWNLGESGAVQAAQARLLQIGGWSKLLKTLKSEQPSGAGRDELTDRLLKVQPAP